MAAISLASLAAAPGPVARQPTGKWVVNFDASQCIATRNYGSAEDSLYLVLKAPPLGDVLQIGILRTGYVRNAAQIDGEIFFDENSPVQTNLLEYGVKRLNQRALLVNLPLQELAPMRAASTIRIRARREQQVIGTRLRVSSHSTDQRFALAQMPQLLKLLDTCVGDLRRVWNVVEEGRRATVFKEPPSGDLQGVFKAEDYPADAIINEQSGSATLAVLIDEGGRVADCTVAGTSRVASLDAQSCAIIKERARFKPAIGLDGKPAKSSWIQRITWRLAG